MREWAAEIEVDEGLARRLLGAQFPELELGSLRLLGQGWDVTVWRVDDDWVFRFPRRDVVVPGLLVEISELPLLASRLPLPVPVPTFVGEPSAEYRWPFYGAPFLPGREPADAALDDEALAGLGRPLGEFLAVLHGMRASADLRVDPVRRADMPFRVPKTLERLAELERLHLWRAPREAHEVIRAASELGPSEPSALVHGDLHLRHLLVDEGGRAAAVIDWVDLSYNSPGVDLVLYWCLLPPAGRVRFIEAYGPIEAAELLRGRLLALFLCGTLAIYGHHEGLPALTRAALLGLDRVVEPG